MNKLDGLSAFKSAAKNPSADSLESIALGAARIRSITDNQLIPRRTDMDTDLGRIDREIWDIIDDLEDIAT